jgi:hypothetical protein
MIASAAACAVFVIAMVLASRNRETSERHDRVATRCERDDQRRDRDD